MRGANVGFRMEYSGVPHIHPSSEAASEHGHIICPFSELVRLAS